MKIKVNKKTFTIPWTKNQIKKLYKDLKIWIPQQFKIQNYVKRKSRKSNNYKL